MRGEQPRPFAAAPLGKDERGLGRAGPCRGVAEAEPRSPAGAAAPARCRCSSGRGPGTGRRAELAQPRPSRSRGTRLRCRGVLGASLPSPPPSAPSPEKRCPGGSRLPGESADAVSPTDRHGLVSSLFLQQSLCLLRGLWAHSFFSTCFMTKPI